MLIKPNQTKLQGQMVSLSTASNRTSLSFCHYCFNCSIVFSFKKLSRKVGKFQVENKKIPQNQFGFVRNRSTINAVQALKTEVAAWFKTNKQTYVCYVNFSKAFDTIVRNQLLEKLKNNGLSTKFHNVLSIILCINCLRICINGFVSDRI